MEAIQEHAPVPGAGIDADDARRPGVPMEAKVPHPMGSAHWKVPEQQPDPGNILKRKGLPGLTPVFGTTLPPRGLSGWMRRAAYEIPEHKTSHWFVLLLADRVDAVEHEPWRALPFVLPVVAAGGAGVWLLANKPAVAKFVGKSLALRALRKLAPW